MAVNTDRQRRKASKFVDLTSPNGTEITVSAERADVLLNRVAVQRGDGTWHKYVLSGESTEVTPEEAKQTLKRSLEKQKDGD